MDNDNKQYLLFVFGNYRNSDKIVEMMSLQISSFISKDTFLKFNYGDHGIIYNFESNFSFYNLRDHIEIILDKLSFQYFFMEHSNNMYAKMPDELKINLFDVYSENKNIEDKQDNDENIFKKLINITSTFLPEDFMFDETKSTTFEDILNRLNDFEDIDEEMTKPTIDDLLEKIQKNGLKSLTKYEKQILDEYSKS